MPKARQRANVRRAFSLLLWLTSLLWSSRHFNLHVVAFVRIIALVDMMVTVPLAPHELAALASFAYNCGAANLKSSTLLRKLNAGDRLGAANQFLRWNRAAGRVMRGLTIRRAAERALFVGANA